MSAAFDLYVPARSWLHEIDPRVKLLFVGLTMLILLLWTSLPLIAVALILTQFALLSAGFGGRRLWGLWRTLLPFLILITLLWPVFERGGTPVLIEWGPLRITGQAVLGGLATAFRLAAISFVFAIWIATTDPRALVRSFVRLGLPFTLGMSLTIGLRFIPTFIGLYSTVSEAQQARGLVLKGRGLQRMRGMIPILVAALVTSLRMSEQLSWTLEARAFGSPATRTTLTDIAMRGTDWLVLAAVSLLCASLLFLTFTAGLGRSLGSPF